MTNRVKLTLPYVESFLSLAETLDFEKREILVLEPEVTPEFSCSACGECCQRPWSVPVSEAYYQKWEPILASDPSKRFAHAFALYDSPTSKKYANIARKPFSHECIFLDDDRKCFIQKTHGEEALSRVCRKYPRYEQWQGAFMGRFLAAGCPDVSQLLMEYPDIYAYRAVFKEQPWKNINQKLHPMGLSNAYAWCGLSLDLAYHPHYTAIQNASRINQVLKGILKRGIDQHSTAYFRELGREAAQGKLPFEEAYDKSRAKKWLLHFSTFLPVLHSFLQQIEHGATAIQPLDPEERELLNSFMRRCLMYRMLTTRPDLSVPFSGFFKSYFEVVLQLVMLQWLALYYRERDQEALNRHHLARAFTQISYRIESNPEAQNTQELKQMPAAMVLEGIDVLLSYDLGQASPLIL
jgi:Fe-S-cluster containining protein